MLNLTEHVHRRYNPLTGEWVLVSPHRSRRPWTGQVEDVIPEDKPAYDPGCYLCPGNTRAHGVRNPAYTSTFVFDNDFAALHDQEPVDDFDVDGLLVARGESGLCRVICFSPRHDLTLAQMKQEELLQIVNLWTQQYAALGARDDIDYVQIFENKGAMMGCSNMHPHGQIWAQRTVPDEPAKETHYQRAYFEKKGSTLLSDYLAIELDQGTRVVFENGSFAVVVPFWAFWPFETMIVSKRAVPHLPAMSYAERNDLAVAIKQITVRYDNLFKTSFPYSAGLHQAPTDGWRDASAPDMDSHPEWHFHMHFYPPLLRSATVRKFKVGYEMLGGGQRDISAESAANLLSALPTTHYKAA